MKKFLLTLITLIMAGFVYSVNSDKITSDSILDRLQSEYNKESNDVARYEAFAVKADEEGYQSVASLFRAAAKSEKVHSILHSSEIKKMGGMANATIDSVDVKTTRENLKIALNGLTSESSYSDFLKQAYSDLELWKAPGKIFLVCTGCGYLASDKMPQKCPACSTASPQFG